MTALNPDLVSTFDLQDLFNHLPTFSCSCMQRTDLDGVHHDLKNNKQKQFFLVNHLTKKPGVGNFTSP